MTWWQRILSWFGLYRPKAKPVAVPPAPKTVAVAFVVRDSRGPVVGATVKLDASGTGQTNADGYLLFPVEAPGDRHVWVTADGYHPVDQHLDIPDHNQDFPITLQPVFVPLPRLTVDGILFRAGGDLWRWKGATGFALYKRFLDGQDISDYLSWARETGFNLTRVFGAYTMNSGDRATWLDPRRYGEDYWQGIAPFLRLCNDHGLYVEWTALCDMQASDTRLGYSVAERQAHLDRLGPILAAQSNAVGEVMNEPPFNGGLDGIADRLRAPGLLVASGSYDYAALCARDFVTVHSGRGDEWPRQIKDPMRELGVTGYGDLAALHKPIVADEPIGAAEYDRGGSRSSVASDFRDYARLCALFGAGGTYHYERGMQGLPPEPGSRQQACAEAFVEGLNGPPMDAATGQYTAGHLGDTPVAMQNELRVFSMLHGNAGTTVIVRKQYSGPPPMRNGWRVVATSPDGGLLTVAR